jgi:hypothetical protein
MWQLETEAVDLPPGEQVLQWGVAGPPNPDVQALMVMNAQFQETAAAPPAREPTAVPGSSPAPGAGVASPP